MSVGKTERVCITWIYKPDPKGRTELVGGVCPQGEWSFTLDEVVERIERGICAFFIFHNGHETDVTVAQKNATGSKYLKTMPDGEPIDNLLSLVKSH